MLKLKKKLDVSVVPIVLTIGIKAHTVPNIPSSGNMVVTFEYRAYILFIFSLESNKSSADNFFLFLVCFFNFSNFSSGRLDNLSDEL